MFYYDREIKYVKGVGEKTSKLFERIGVFTLGALLHYFPKSYTDFSNITKLGDAPFNKDVCIKAKITSSIEKHIIRKNMVLYKFTIFDKSGGAEVTLFNNKYLAEKLEKDKEYLFYGKLKAKKYGSLLDLSSPEIIDIKEAIITPQYYLTKGLYNKTIIRVMKNALLYLEDVDFIPNEIKQKYRLLSHKDAIYNIHFPKNHDALKAAKRRLVFEELFLLNLGQLILKNKNQFSRATAIKNSFLEDFKKNLPFKLTEGQLNAINDCLIDMSKEVPMSRLLQGDVGCGKTAVAAALIHTVAKNNKQSVLMAPTGILAIQHFNTFKALLPDINIALLIGNTKKSEKEQIKKDFKEGKIQLLVGTHAIITENSDISGAVLCITDEQHRFGVKQRAKLGNKAGNPHTLYMSATPIPRTLGLVIYGELDISTIHSMPLGRQTIKTYLIDSSIRKRAYSFIKKHIDNGRQAYIVCPLVEEGETSLVPATLYKENLQNGFFKDYKVGLLHGKMKNSEKESVMNDFLAGKINILVSTTIVEVGVDVPNSTVMLIENAERFGLSTLHQLRGRIGRGNFESFFIMISDFDTERLKIMCENTDGFKIAEEDLRLRGPGDFLGERQHGLPELKLANLIDDSVVMKIAREEAEKLLTLDPLLKNNSKLKQMVLHLFKNLD